MTGYNLYLIDEDGDCLFLRLTYATLAAAQEAVTILETVYGPGRLEIDAQSPYLSCAE